MAKKKPSSPEPEPEPEEESDNSEEPEPEEESDNNEEEEEEEEEEESEEEESLEEESEEEESDEDLSNRETLRGLLEPFGKEQLIELLKEAADRNPSLLSRISQSAESDPAHRRIFVYGLSWDCTTETLAASFRPFGDIEECCVVPDRTTGRGKGYGFVLFRTLRGTRNALKEPQKVIGGRSTSCQLASKGKSLTADGSKSGRKVFVSNIEANVNPERLKAFFARFGEIEEGPLGYDKTSGKFSWYAIFVYKTVEGCKKALEEPVKVFDGCTLQCQRALEGVKPKVPEAMTVPAVSTLPPNNPALTYASSYGNPAGNPAVPAVNTLPPNNPALTYASSYGNPAEGFLGQGIGVQSGGVGMLIPVGRQSGGVGLLNPVGRQSGGVGMLIPVGRQSGGVGLLNPVGRQSGGVGLLNPLGGQSGGVGLLNPVGGQSGGVGLLNPVAGASLSANRSVTPTSYGAGTGVNTVSPSVIGSYQSQAALQGLGGYQSQSVMNPGMKSQSSLGSSGSGLPSYLGR